MPSYGSQRGAGAYLQPVTFLEMSTMGVDLAYLPQRSCACQHERCDFSEPTLMCPQWIGEKKGFIICFKQSCIHLLSLMISLNSVYCCFHAVLFGMTLVYQEDLILTY